MAAINLFGVIRLTDFLLFAESTVRPLVFLHAILTFFTLFRFSQETLLQYRTEHCGISHGRNIVHVYVVFNLHLQVFLW
jgi:hypothetical protein